MAKKLFYNRHSLVWMRKFTNSIPKNSHLSRPIAFCLAAAIHHQTTIKKSSSIQLTHTVLEEFSLHRRHLKRYLKYFQKAKLIQFSISQGSTLSVKLLEKDRGTIYVNKRR